MKNEKPSTTAETKPRSKRYSILLRKVEKNAKHEKMIIRVLLPNLTLKQAKKEMRLLWDSYFTAKSGMEPFKQIILFDKDDEILIRYTNSRNLSRYEHNIDKTK